MNKYIKSTFALSLLTLGWNAYAEEVKNWGDVPVLYNAYGHKISPDGTFSVGEAVDAQSAWGRDNTTGDVYFYDACSLGDGNCINKDNVVVGTDKMFMKGAFLMPQKNADPVLVSSLKKYTESYLHGTTWDGTRIVGILSNPGSYDMDENDPEKQRMSYLPFCCEVNTTDYTASDPVLLPTPPRDFFGLVPQYCTAEWISDDGKVILGQVIDNSGNFSYPIVYTQESDGNWSFSLPSEPIFNPDNLDIPRWPVPEFKEPDPVDYISNPEFKKLFQTLLLEMLDGGDVNPYDLLNPAVAGKDALMTEEEWTKYYQARTEYDAYYYDVYEKEIDKYYEEYSKFIAKATNFLQSSMSMNSAGTMIAQTKITNRFAGNFPVEYRNPVVFNLENNDINILGDEFCELEISQILPDGTLIAISPQPTSNTPDLTPQHSYVMAPGATSFTPIENYIKASNPGYYEWYMEYLHHEVPIGYDNNGEILYKEMTVTGLVSVSDDFTAMSGGLDGWSWDYDNGDYYTYFFTNMVTPDAGVDSILNNDGSLRVYNLQGVKILDVKNPLESVNLPKGIYIINGKKTVVK